MKNSSVSRFVAGRIREIRQNKGLRVADVAAKSGIPVGSLSCLEHGYYRPNLDVLMRVLLALDSGIEDVWPQSGKTLRRGQVADEAFVREALRKARQSNNGRRRVEIQDVVAAVSAAYGLTVEELMGRGRRKTTPARVAAALFVRKSRRLTQSDLCLYLLCSEGGLSHSIRRHRESVQSSKEFQEACKRLRKKFGEAFSERGKG